MRRNKKLSEQRASFVKLAMEDKSKAARELRETAYSLGYARTQSDIIYALSQIFCVSEKTIKRDLKANV